MTAEAGTGPVAADGSRLRAGLLLLAVAIAALYFVYRRGADLNWDLLNYHHYAGYMLLHGRLSEDIAAAHLQSFLNPTWNALTYLINSFLPFPWSAWLIAGAQLSVLPVVALVCAEIARTPDGSPRLPGGLLALGVTLAAPLWWSELGTTFSEASTAPLVLLGLLCALRATSPAQPAQVARRYACAGALMGLATGLKMTNAVFAAALPCTLVVLVLRGGVRASIRGLVAYALGAALGLVPVAWWHIYLAVQWGNPVFPLYNAVFQSPYFDFVNFRDTRWTFGSTALFASFLVEAVRGTVKTSEVPFADARLAIVAVLASLYALVLGHRLVTGGHLRALRSGSLSPGPNDALLVFYAAAVGLWAIVFAYQRYKVPVELLTGLVIWVLARRLVRADVLAPLMAASLAIALYCLLIPDWGHDKSLRDAGPGRFGLHMPQELAASPALYLVSGVPASYVYPFLAPGSRFLRIDFSPRIEPRIKASLASNQSLPVGLLSFEDRGPELTALAKQFGLAGPDKQPWTCSHFRSAVHRFVACRPEPSEAARSGAERDTYRFEVDFRHDGPLSRHVIGASGLHAREGWGRWSIGETVIVEFARCLPQGELLLQVTAHAFGPNAGAPFTFRIGQAAATLYFDKEPSIRTARLSNTEPCSTRLTIEVPRKTSPAELGLGADPRSLGLGVAALTLARVDSPVQPGQ